MILFHDRTNDVQVIRTRNSGLGVDNIGILRQPDNGEKNPDWTWDERSGWDRGDNLSPPEKLCIIGMLDKLNNFGYSRIGTRQARWREITGLPEATF